MSDEHDKNFSAPIHKLIRRTELLEKKLDRQQKTLDAMLADLAELSRAQRWAGGCGREV
jgi:hypothetical protein